MTPVVNGLEQIYGQQVAFKRVNANQEDGPAIMQTYRIPGHPTTLIFNRQGQEIERLVGPQPAETVEELLLTTLQVEQN